MANRQGDVDLRLAQLELLLGLAWLGLAWLGLAWLGLVWLGLATHSVLYTQPLKMELTEGSETSANHNLTPGKYPKEYTLSK
jgi:hypothetical protein